MSHPNRKNGARGAVCHQAAWWCQQATRPTLWLTTSANVPLAEKQASRMYDVLQQDVPGDHDS